MTATEIRKLGALEIGAAIKEGKITSVEATKAFLDAIDAKDGEYKSYITVIFYDKDTEKRTISAQRGSRLHVHPRCSETSFRLTMQR